MRSTCVTFWFKRRTPNPTTRGVKGTCVADFILTRESVSLVWAAGAETLRVTFQMHDGELNCPGLIYIIVFGVGTKNLCNENNSVILTGRGGGALRLKLKTHIAECRRQDKWSENRAKPSNRLASSNKRWSSTIGSNESRVMSQSAWQATSSCTNLSQSEASVAIHREWPDLGLCPRFDFSARLHFHLL